jgi:hypothetical protein
MSRVYKPKVNFTQVSNHIANNPEAGLHIKGMYFYIKSRSGEEISLEQMAEDGGCDIETAQSYLEELMRLGYLELIQNTDDGDPGYRLLNEPKEKL